MQGPVSFPGPQNKREGPALAVRAIIDTRVGTRQLGFMGVVSGLALELARKILYRGAMAQSRCCFLTKKRKSGTRYSAHTGTDGSILSGSESPYYGGGRRLQCLPLLVRKCP